MFSTNLASTGGAAVNLPVLPLLVHSSILHAPCLTVSVKIIVTAVTITTSAAASDAAADATAVAITIATAAAVATAIAAVTAVAVAAAVAVPVAVAISSATAVAVATAVAAAAAAVAVPIVIAPAIAVAVAMAVAAAAAAVAVPIASPMAFPFATAGTTAMSVTEFIQRYPYLFIFFGLKILKLAKYIFQIRKYYCVFILNETSQTTVGHICGEISSWSFFFFPPEAFATDHSTSWQKILYLCHLHWKKNYSQNLNSVNFSVMTQNKKCITTLVNT